MRTLCLLLILANALYFIWSQLIDVHGQQSRCAAAKPSSRRRASCSRAR